jgi:glycosyltransferase involved in cell wall biosynthesis
MLLKKYRVFFFIDSFRVGGMHKQILYLLKYLNKKEFEPIICISSSRGGLSSEFIQSGCKMIDLKWKRSMDVSLIPRLVKALYSENPDIVFITEAQNLIYFKVARIFWFKRKFAQIGSYRALTFWYNSKNSFYKNLDTIASRLLYASSDKVVVNSQAMKDHYSKIVKIKKDKEIAVIYNGFDSNYSITKSPEELRKDLMIEHNEIVIIIIARLDPWKDFQTLFEAAKLVIKQKQDLRFIILGDGILRESLKMSLSQFGIQENFIMLGERVDAYNYLNFADISILSTYGEGFSNSLMESMALGKPVIASDIGGNSETIGKDGVSGYLVPPRSPEMMAEVLLLLANNKYLRERIGKNGKVHILNLCSMDKFITSFESLFRDAVKSLNN